MAEAPTSPPKDQPAAPPRAMRAEVPPVLAELRARIQRYVALEGGALVLVVLGGAFWVSLAADYWLELSAPVRRLLLVAAGGAAAAAFVWYLLLRVVRPFRARALALVLERRFPELGDRLITAVELSESTAADTSGPLTAAMYRQTAGEAAELSRRLQLREVFNKGPLLKAALAAAALVLSIAAFGWASGETLGAWFRRNVLMADELYRRDTDLTVVVLAEPGERLVEFQEGVYRHPRGADLTFLATVPEGRIVPEQVRYSYHHLRVKGGGGDTMTKIGQRQFRQRLAGLHESIHLWLRGGDYSTREPYRIEVVEPPQIDRMTLACLYPEYTGLNARDESSAAPVRQEVPVLGAQVALPAGTDLLMQAEVNKPLRALRVQTDGWELRVTRDGAQIARPTAGAAPPEWLDLPAGEPLLDADGRRFVVPCLLRAAAGPEALADAGPPRLPLPLPPDALIRLWLHDEDDVQSSEPARLTIHSIADEPPHVETRLKGIGTSITRQATIPVAGEIQDVQDGSQRYGVTDDYGVAEARFEYKLDAPVVEGAAPAYQPVPFESSPNGVRAFPVAERFQVLPLDLAVGVRFTLKVVAQDADDLTGPHIASGQPWSFQVVSDDELLAQIAVKELNLRRRFEQILDEVRNTRKDLLLARTRLDEDRAAGPDAPPAGAGGASDRREQRALLEQAVSSAVDRSITGIRKNANETLSIEEEFREIREEIENNAVPDARPMLERLDDGIIRPLHSINTVDYNDVDDALVVLRQALEDRAFAPSGFNEPIDRLSSTIERLEAVLAQMLKLESINEALQLLRDIIQSQEELQEKTRAERKRKLIEGLK